MLHANVKVLRSFACKNSLPLSAVFCCCGAALPWSFPLLDLTGLGVRNEGVDD